ncbi:MAG: endo-1,4-beta-xylanase [Halioglobus sp.]
MICKQHNPWSAVLLALTLAACSNSSDNNAGDEFAGADTLRAAAEQRDFFIGTAFVEGSQDARFGDTAAAHFNSLTIPLYASQTHPAPDSYNFTVADQAVALAQHAGMRMRGHPLIWGRLALPDYVSNETDPTVLERWMRDHISTLMSRYRGKFSQVDVVNEPLSLLALPGQSEVPLANDVFSRLLGKDFIRIAFEAARAADPNALLFINEIFAEAPGAKADALYHLVEELISEGTPIDGVGFQGHMQLLPGMQANTREALQETLTRFAALGVIVELTEVDVTQREGDAVPQETVYRDAVSACLDVVMCTGMTVWGISDAYTWVEGIIGVPNPRPLLFDEDFAPKPAYDAVLDTLLSN